MLLAGIVGREGRIETSSLISSFLVSTGKRVSVADSGGLSGLEFKRIRSYISELERNKTDILLLKLNVCDIEKLIINGVCFDVMIFTGSMDDIDKEETDGKSFCPERLSALMSERGISIINFDDRELISIFESLKHHVVTYGFNSKASITTSSIGDSLLEGSFMCCLQRSIPTQSGRLIGPQEYKLRLEHGEFDTHNILAAASFAIVNGIDLNGFSGI